MNLTEYNQMVEVKSQAMTPRERRIIEMQDRLDALKNEVKTLEDNLKAEMDVLGNNYNHDMFRVADLKVIRVADMQLVKDNHPEYYNSPACYPTAKDLGTLIMDVFSMDDIINRLEKKAPGRFDELRTARVTDMDKVFGKRETDNLCYRKTMATSKTRLVAIKQPGEFSMFNAPKRNMLPERDYSDLPEDA